MPSKKLRENFQNSQLTAQDLLNKIPRRSDGSPKPRYRQLASVLANLKLSPESLEVIKRNLEALLLETEGF